MWCTSIEKAIRNFKKDIRNNHSACKLLDTKVVSDSIYTIYGTIDELDPTAKIKLFKGFITYQFKF